MSIQTIEPPAPPTAMRTCRRCGNAASLELSYCETCGASLALGWGGEPPPAPQRRLGGTKWVPIEEIEPGEATKPATSFAAPAPAAPRTKRRTSKRAPLYRRRIVVIPLLMVILATTLAGVLTYRARATFNQVQQLSEVPDLVTDATQGDDGLPSDMTFDTGPAREALEMAGVTSG